MKKSTEHNLKLFFNISLTFFGTLLLLYLGIKAIFYFVPFVVGYIISLIFRPLIRVLENKFGLNRKLSSVIIIILLSAIICLVLFFSGRTIFNKVYDFVLESSEFYNKYLKDFIKDVNNKEGLFSILPASVSKLLKTLVNNIRGVFATITSSATPRIIDSVSTFVSKLPYYIICTIIIIMSSYYFMSDSVSLKHKASKILPKSIISKLELIGHEIKYGIGGYFKAQFKIMIVIYIILVVGLLILKAPFAALIALGIALLDLLPILGTGFVLIPWALIKFLLADYFAMAGFLILYVICLLVHQALQPKMIGDSVEMPTMLTLIGLFVGFKVDGIIGMIVGIIVCLIIWRLYQDGSFDNLISNFNELIDNVFDDLSVNKKKGKK